MAWEDSATWPHVLIWSYHRHITFWVGHTFMYSHKVIVFQHFGVAAMIVEHNNIDWTWKESVHFCSPVIAHGHCHWILLFSAFMPQINFSSCMHALLNKVLSLKIPTNNYYSPPLVAITNSIVYIIYEWIYSAKSKVEKLGIMRNCLN